MSERKRRRPVVQFLAWLLMAAGVLIFTTAGACSLLFMVLFMPAGNNYYFGDLGGMSLMVLTVGGIPFLIGLALFLGGRRLEQPPRTPKHTARPTEHNDEPTTGA